MIQMIKRLLDFSGSERNSLIASFLFSLLDSVFEMMPIMAILTVLSGLLSVAEGGVMAASTIWLSLIIMLVSIAGRIFFNNLSCTKRTLGSFAMCAQKRLEIGEHMKRVPMGYFSENRLGEIAAAATTTLGDIENNAVTVLERVAGGFIHAIVIGVWLLFYEWHIGLLMFAGLAVSMLVYAGIQKAAKHLSPRRQEAQANLVTCFLEYIQGMGVVKGISAWTKAPVSGGEAVNESAGQYRFGKHISALPALIRSHIQAGKIAIIIVAPYLLLGGEITSVKCLLLLVSSFMVYSSVELVGSMASVARVIDASLDRLEAVTDTPILDENGEDFTPEHFDIELKNISFAYGKEDVLKNINIEIPEKTTCAIVGPSGSGKTTLVSLIARFWDVREGEITVGGRNVKDYTCDSLLKNFSMVFQNVYLFEDTIENNIKFGRPDATHKQVVEAAKKACCHDFISALPGWLRYKGRRGRRIPFRRRKAADIYRPRHSEGCSHYHFR